MEFVVPKRRLALSADMVQHVLNEVVCGGFIIQLIYLNFFCILENLNPHFFQPQYFLLLPLINHQSISCFFVPTYLCCSYVQNILYLYYVDLSLHPPISIHFLLVLKKIPCMFNFLIFFILHACVNFCIKVHILLVATIKGFKHSWVICKKNISSFVKIT